MTPPKVIYLQWYDEDTGEELDPIDDEVTWCVDRINDSDVVYVIQDERITKLIAALRAIMDTYGDDEGASPEKMFDIAEAALKEIKNAN